MCFSGGVKHKGDRQNEGGSGGELMANDGDKKSEEGCIMGGEVHLSTSPDEGILTARIPTLSSDELTDDRGPESVSALHTRG